MMEAKVTALPKIRGQLENFAKDAIEYYQKTGLCYPPSLERTAKTIAEISFKAGWQEGYETGKHFATINMPNLIKEAEQEGIRKAVEWIDNNNVFLVHPDNRVHFLSAWQAQLKEWRIE